MSSLTQPTDISTSNFVNIFNAASSEYKRLTRKDLQSHPFAAVLLNCDSPDAVLNVFRTQAIAFHEFRQGDDKLMKWLDPTVNILFTFSATLGEGIALVSGSTSIHSLPLCLNKFVSAILPCENNIYWYWCPPRGMSPLKLFHVVSRLSQVAKDVIASHASLVNLFERIQLFLQRLSIYTGIPLTGAMAELLGKIMAQVLSILALSTKQMTQRRISECAVGLMQLCWLTMGQRRF
jgi:hypothetical protein